MSVRQRACGLLASSLLMVSLWATPAEAHVQFETRQACITSPALQGQQPTLLQLEVAETNEQRARGLMERTSLSDNSGMVFIYPTTGLRSFWMYRTRIPLDIAFMNAQGVVMEVQQMAPCHERKASRCPTYRPAVPYKMALEMAAGRFAALHITTGSKLSLHACPQEIGNPS
ncbi:DUF192 domain-containing protein [Aliidiomarina taiwanensis]|nr:DUF192 domain-containing protein [Aliidiomarina taiwanensis]